MIYLHSPPTFTSAFPGLPDGKPARQPANVRAKAFKASLRRRAQLKAASEIVPHLPQPGESLHALMTGYYDLMLVLAVIIQSRPVPCRAVRSPTPSYAGLQQEECTRAVPPSRQQACAAVDLARVRLHGQEQRQCLLRRGCRAGRGTR